MYDGIGLYTTSASSIGVEANGAAPSSYMFTLGTQGTNVANSIYAYALIDGANATGLKSIISHSNANGTAYSAYAHQGTYAGTSVISSISIFSETGNLDAGTVYVYGSGA